MKRNHEHTYDHRRWHDFKATLIPRQVALHAEAAKLDLALKKATGEKARSIKKRHHEIIAQLQDELIPVKTYSTFEHTELCFDTEHKVHVKIRGL